MLTQVVGSLQMVLEHYDLTFMFQVGSLQMVLKHYELIFMFQASGVIANGVKTWTVMM